MHGSLEFMVNNHPTPTAAPEDKGGYLAYSLMHSRMSEQSFNCKLVHMADGHSRKVILNILIITELSLIQLFWAIPQVRVNMVQLPVSTWKIKPACYYRNKGEVETV